MKFPQLITYWAATPSGDGGFTFSAPISLKGLWEDKQELVADATGNQIVSQAIVYLNTEVAINGYLFLGTSIATDPTTVTKAWQIKNYGETPNVRGTEVLRKAVL